MQTRRTFLRRASGLLVPMTFPAVIGQQFSSVARVASWTRAASASTVVPPSDIPGLSAWWKADSLSLADGTAVGNGSSTDWLDSSGNSKTLTQASSGSRPVYKTNIIGSMPVVRFDNVNDNLSFTQINCGDAFTIMFVGDVTEDAIIFGWSLSNTQFRRYRSSTDTISKYWGTIDQSSTTFSTAHGTPCLSIWRRTARVAGGVVFRENTTSRGTVTDNDNVSVNRMGTTTFGVLAGDMAEACIWASVALSDADCDNLYNNYFKARWGLP